MHRRIPVLALGLALAVAAIVWRGAVAQPPVDLFFSEYIEGSSNNKALEIYNSTSAPVDLGAGQYNVQMFFNGSSTAGLTINLAGVVAGGDVFVLAQASANTAILAQADQINGSGWFNGDDAVVLRKGSTVLDVIGQIGFDPGSEWGAGLTSTADNTLVRVPTVCAGDADGSNAFDPAVAWIGFPIDTVSSLGAHASDCTGVAPTATPTQAATPTPTPTPVDPCTLPYTPIPAIQGNGAAAAVTGAVTTQGVVVGDFEGASPALRGFYLQDMTGDGDTATSDAIFVFNGNNNSVSLGDVVRVSGTAAEFQEQTQLSASAILRCGTGSVAPVDVLLPIPFAVYLERYEGMLVRFNQRLYVTEHFQLGRFGQVVMTAQLGRQRVPTDVAAPGAPAQAVAAANLLNRIIIDDALNNQNPDPVLLARNNQPLSASNTLRGGDYIDAPVGVLTYGWAGNSASGNAYRLRPQGAPNLAFTFMEGNPRPAAPEPVAGTVSVASFNLLNYFNTFDGLPDTVDNCTNGVGGAATDCRGADTAAEFARQAPKSVAAIAGLNADVIGIIEIENDGYGLDSAIQDLVNRVNAVAGAGAYAFIDADAATGQVNALGTDAIKVGILYKPAKVTPVGRTAALNSDAFVNGGDSSPRNRPALAQAFVEKGTGASFVVVVNHLKSKGSACDIPDAGDGQGECNIVRTNAARELVNWLASNPTGAGVQNILIVGDLNSYAMEQPIALFEDPLNALGGLTNLVKERSGADAYSYVFNGEWGYLDHALASQALRPHVASVTEWHINADEPSVLDYNEDFKSANQKVTFYSPDAYRASDHDPLLVGLCMPPALNVTVSPNVLWPPNHKYVSVAATIVTGAAVAVSVDVVSNEPDNGLGDGDTPVDIQVISPTQVNLRAERAGGGTGRIYTLTYRAQSACGAVSTATSQVTVPARWNGRAGELEMAAGALLDPAAVELAERMYLPLLRNR